MKEKKDYSGIDIFKFFMAISVVAIHVEIFKDFGNKIISNILFNLLDLAVPYFFIASGFFFFLKINLAISNVQKNEVFNLYIRRVIELYIFWTCLYLPITIWSFFKNDAPFHWDATYFLFNVILVGENYFSWSLWYLLSIFYSLSLLYYLQSQDFQVKNIVIICLLFYLAYVSLTYIYSQDSSTYLMILIKKITKGFFNNGKLFSGMIYLFIGYLFANDKIHISNNKSLFIFIFSFIIYYLRVPFISQIIFIFMPIIVFKWSLMVNIKSKINGYMFRKLSTVIYFTHMIVFFIITHFFPKFSSSNFILFFISISVPILFTYIVIKFEKKVSLFRKIF